MEDIFLRLLVVSDSFISSLRTFFQKKLKSLSPEAIQLLILPIIKITDKSSNISIVESADYDLTDDSTDDEQFICQIIL